MTMKEWKANLDTIATEEDIPKYQAITLYKMVVQVRKVQRMMSLAEKENK